MEDSNKMSKNLSVGLDEDYESESEIIKGIINDVEEDNASS